MKKERKKRQEKRKPRWDRRIAFANNIPPREFQLSRFLPSVVECVVMVVGIYSWYSFANRFVNCRSNRNNWPAEMDISSSTTKIISGPPRECGMCLSVLIFSKPSFFFCACQVIFYLCPGLYTLHPRDLDNLSLEIKKKIKKKKKKMKEQNKNKI